MNITARSGGLVSVVVVSVQPPPTQNNAPMIDSLTASAGQVPVNTPVNLSATTHDADGDALSYQWTSTGACGFSAPTALATAITCSDVATHTVTLTVTDSVGKTAAVSFALDVIADPGYSMISVSEFAPMSVAPSTLPPVAPGSSFQVQLYASGGVAPYKWKRLSALPAGLRLGKSGQLSGTVRSRIAQGTYEVQVGVSDSTKHGHKSATGTITFTIM